MNALKSERCIDAIHAQTPPAVQTVLPADTTDTTESESLPRHFKSFSAVGWIIAAWLVGTLVSELNVIGAESRPAETIEISVDHQSTDHR